MQVRVKSLAVLSVALSSVTATHLGFNYGAFFTDNSPKTQKDFEDEFNTARSLSNAPPGGFISARLYTMVQHQTKQDVISVIPAAIATDTSLLLCMWCSTGEAGVTNELAALNTAINTYGANFTNLVVGLSVGSEDLYRNSATAPQRHSATAKANHETNPGLDPATLAGYINRVRASLNGTALAHTPIGHVDTWTVWADASNRAVVDAVDWLGMDAYSYWQREQPDNAVDQGKRLFDSALNQTRAAAAAAAGGPKKQVWITETGWPVSGKTQNQAVSSAENAKRFWDEVGCPLFGRENVWWYTLRDSSANGTAQPNFGIVGADLAKGPLFDISCGGKVEEPDVCDAS